MTSFRSAAIADVSRLLPLMRDFYEYERLPFDPARTERLLRELIADESLGRVFLFEADDSSLVGYMILTFGYSLEFGGRDALIDEFYVTPTARGSGIGSHAVSEAIAFCRTKGISNIHLEADHFNTRVHVFYERLGFRDHERHLMTLSI